MSGTVPERAPFTRISVERHGPVGWVVFDRPDAGNAMDATMLAELERVWPELDADPDVVVIVITGNGPSFQTGLDVKQLSRDPAALRDQARRTRAADLRFTPRHDLVGKPVVTAVNGACAGGGLHFVADADVVIASSDATFFDPHVSVGQVTAFEAIALMKKVPAESVLRMALVGRHERVSARRAHQLGLVSQVVDPPDRLREEAQALAEAIARNSPAALRATKRALNRALELGLTDACRAAAADLVGLWGHPDQQEGPLAFAAGREPRWQHAAAGHAAPSSGREP